MAPLETAAAPPLCSACDIRPAKYRCPACDRRTCSSACVAAHKVQHSCTGKRARAEYVAPLKAFTDQLLLRDFGLLQEVDAAVDRANRQLHRGAEELKLHHFARHRQRISLARACAAPERQLRLVLAPGAMAVARSNTSRVVECPGAGAGGPRARWWQRFGKGKGKGKGKDKGKGKGKGKGKKGSEEEMGPVYISWRVEWRFGHCGSVLVDRGLPETEVLGPTLSRLLENDACRGRATKHLLLPYAKAGLAQLQVFLEQGPRAEAALATTAAEACGTGPRHGQSSASEDEEEVGHGHGGQARQQLRRPMAREAGGGSGDEDGASEEEEEDGEEAQEEGCEGRGGARAVPGAAGRRRTPFLRLDKGLSLLENLRGRAVVEFPVLHVALPEELGRFEGAGAA